MFWKKNKKEEFKCADCGKIHNEWPALGFNSPSNYHNLSEKEKNEIAKLDSDFCEIHYEDQIDRFIRVTLKIKVKNACETLEYGVWVSLSEKSYLDYQENFKNTNHQTGYFGWLCNCIPDYEDTMSIPCDVITMTGNRRPEIVPHQNFDHLLVKDYYEGISFEEAKRRIDEILN
jgi:hypothetical protein